MGRIYHELASLWPLLSPPADYEPEAAQVRAVLRAHHIIGSDDPAASDTAPPSLIELGAGGGHTLSHLKAGFDCTAVDLSPEMLEVSRQLNPECRHVAGDMRTLRLAERFDAVLIHDAVDYMATPADAQAAVVTAAAHLKPHGVVILAPTYVSETFADNESALDVNTSPDGLEAAFLSRVHRGTGNRHTFELAMLLMVRQPEGRLTVEEDRHTCGLFSVDAWLAMLCTAGLEAEVTSFVAQPDAEDAADAESGEDPTAARAPLPELAAFTVDAPFPQNIPWFVGRLPRVP